MVGFNIYHRKDNRWEGRIKKDGESGNKRSFIYFFAKTKEAVQSKMISFKLNNQNNNSKCSVQLKVIYNEWLQSIQLRTKESTRANYQLKWNNHIYPVFGELAVSEITTNDIYNFIHTKQNSGLSDRYISDIIVLMKSIFKFAVKHYHIEDPLDGIIMPKKKPAEIKILDDNKNDLKNYLLENLNSKNLGIMLAMTTGIRIGELCALQWKDIDFEKRTLTVRKTIQRIQTHSKMRKTKLIMTEPKSETSKRCIPLPESVLSLLCRFKGNDDFYICSGKEKPVEPRTMQYRFAKILKNVNLPSVHFHALRHMFASECVKLGFDIKALSELLGHSSVRITLERYVHSDFAIKQEYMKRITFA